MSTSTITIPRRTAQRLAWAGDYLELSKPRIAALILVVVAVAGYLARWGQPDPLRLLHAMLGTLLVAASASAWNQWLERGRDARMERTANRPLPAGRLTAWQVALFGSLTLLLGTAYLALFTTLTAAGLGLLTWLLYVVLYTPLKARSPLNTAVGAVAGALPVLIGWVACGGRFELLHDPRGGALFLVLFLWQFPHFMAIAWRYRSQYAAAGLQMSSVVDPTGRGAGVQAVLAALALLPASFLLAWNAPGIGGTLYLLAAFLLGAGQLALAVRFCLRRDELSARRLLRASLIYLPALLAMSVLLPLV